MMNLSEVVSSKVVPLVAVVLLMVIGAGVVVDSAATRSSTGPTTRGVQQQQHGGKPHSGDVWKYVSSLEQSTSRRFDQMESRLTRTLEERIQLVNHTASIEYLEKYMQMLNDQLTEDEEEAKNNQLQMEEMRRQNRLQETTIEELRQKLTGLQETAARLTTAVEECRARGEEPPPESLMSTGSEDSPPSTVSASVSPTTPKLLPIDCQEAYDNESADQQRGFYNRQIKPRTSDGQFKACCFANQSAEVWTVIQRRFDGSVEFYRSWDEYKEGFGDVAGGEFWLGNDHIYHLTNQGDYRLRIEMRTWDDEFRWAEYRRFRVADETDKYRLRVAGYSGDAGNSLSSAWDNDHNGQQFSTYDADNDDRFYDNCAEHYRGAWWFRSCFRSHLNGVYYPKGDHSNFFVRNGIQWDSIDQHSSLKEVTMMIRANEEAEAEEEDGEEGEALLSNGIEKDA